MIFIDKQEIPVEVLMLYNYLIKIKLEDVMSILSKPRLNTHEEEIVREKLNEVEILKRQQKSIIQKYYNTIERKNIGSALLQKL